MIMNKQEQKKMNNAIMYLLSVSSDNNFEPLECKVNLLGMNFEITFSVKNLGNDNKDSNK